MKIIGIKTFRSPNIWSNYRKKIMVASLDLEDFVNIYSNQIANFNERLVSLLPSLHSHRCSEGKEGGFLNRLEQGTLLGHVVEHVALELQTLAGMDCGYGRTRESRKEGVFNIVYSYVIEEAGIYAIHAALHIVEVLVRNDMYMQLNDHIQLLRKLHAEHRLGISTEAIIDEAGKRDIPYTLLNNEIIMLGYGCNQRIISAAMGPNTSCTSVDLVSDKGFTKEVLASSYISVANGVVIKTSEQLLSAINEIKFPVVIKPRYGNHGKGVTTNIQTVENAVAAFHQAKKISNSVIVERYTVGDDYRFLIINYKLVAAAKRIPASILGDGKKTILQLIEQVNSHPLRGRYHENLLTSIMLDHKTLILLAEKGLTPDTILPKNQLLYLKDTANLSTGGTAIDVTDIVHEDTVAQVERIARLTNLDMCGIDVIAKNIEQPLTIDNGVVLEVNASPGLRMHLAPSFGKKRNVAEPIVDMLYPAGQPSRIPITAVTGTNGKTTVVRLLAHIANQANHFVGMTTTEGIYIKQKQICEGDCSGPESATVVLRDRKVDFAVLECARGGIIRSGLGFDKCQVSILTNISEDHLGFGDVQTKDDLLWVKSVVPYSTSDDGYAVLNAEDDLVYSLKDKLSCRVALFSQVKSKKILAHAKQGGLCCFMNNDVIYIAENNNTYEIINITNVPISFDGQSEGMIQNVLAATLAAWANKINPEAIVKGLISFFPTPLYLPGRMNLFDFKNCKVMLDYAHNESAYVFLKDYLSTIHARKKVGIIAGTGDRRDIDIWKTGYFAALMFDFIIIRQDEESCGRSQQEITDIILAGIHHVDANKLVKCIDNEFDAINYAISTAAPDTFIWYFPDKVLNAVRYLQDYQKTDKYSYRLPIHQEA